MLISAPLGGSPLALLCSFTFSHTFCGGTASSCFLFFIFGHSHFLCPFFSHPKHFTSPSTISCLLTSLTPHCITRLLSASNLLPTTVFFFCSSPFLHFRARCPNLPHFLQILSSLPSNSALNLARARLSLSISLMSLLYWSRDIVVSSGQAKWFVCKKKDVYCLRVRCLFHRAHSTSAGVHKSFPSQVPTALLTTALIVLWLSLQGGDPYTNHLLKDVAIFLCVD